MEELPPERLGGICMETDGLRVDSGGIRKLYESEAYPLERRKIPRRRMKRSGAALVVNQTGDRQ